jgi:hypothetical protein
VLTETPQALAAKTAKKTELYQGALKEVVHNCSTAKPETRFSAATEKLRDLAAKNATTNPKEYRQFVNETKGYCVATYSLPTEIKRGVHLIRELLRTAWCPKGTEARGLFPPTLKLGCIETPSYATASAT